LHEHLLLQRWLCSKGKTVMSKENERSRLAP